MTSDHVQLEVEGRLPTISAGESWLSSVRFAALLALFIFAMFPTVLLGSRTFVIRDFGLFSFPVAQFFRESFWHGQFPQWNPFNFCGTPFLAQWNTMVLYPGSLLYLLFPLTWSLPFFCLCHLFWGGLGMFFLARHWTKNALAAAIAGIVFSFNGLSLNFLMWPSHEATFSWLPWVLWLGQLGWREGGKSLVWAVASASMQMLAGGPETILFTWLILLLLISCDLFARAVAPIRALLRFFAIGVLVFLICAAQLLPFLEFAADSQRDSGFAGSDWSMPIWGWANFLVPLFRCIHTNFGIFQQPGQYITSSYYPGIVAVWLGMVALRRSRDWRVYVVSLVVICGMLLALGDAGWIYHRLRLWFPALGFARYPIKFVIPVLGVAPLMAALGFATIAKSLDGFQKFEWASAVALLLMVAGLVWYETKFPLTEDSARVTLLNASARAGFLLLALLLMFFFLKANGSRRIWLGTCLLAALWADLATHMPTQNPTVAPYVYELGWAAGELKLEPQPATGASRVMQSARAYDILKFNAVTNNEEDFLLNRLAFMADCNLLDDVPQVGGFFSLTPVQINNITALPLLKPGLSFSPLMDFMGVAYTTATNRVSEWVPRSTAMPLITSGQSPRFVTDNEAFALCFESNINFRSTVLLPESARPFIRVTNATPAKLTVEEFSSQKVLLKTESSSPSLLVVSQTWYPAWKAYVDGAPTRLLRANYAFQAVQVPAGKRTVVISYEDDAFRAGLVLSMIGLAALLLGWFLSFSKTRAKEVLKVVR